MGVPAPLRWCGVLARSAQWACSGRRRKPLPGTLDPRGPRGRRKEVPTQRFALQPPAKRSDGLPGRVHRPPTSLLSTAIPGPWRAGSVPELFPGIPFCFSRPPTWGVRQRDKDKHKSCPCDLEIVCNAPDREADAVSQPNSPPPERCCVVPRDKDPGTKGQEKPPNAQAGPPRVNSCPQQMPTPDTRSPCSGREEAGFRLGAGRNLLLW